GSWFGAKTPWRIAQALHSRWRDLPHSQCAWDQGDPSVLARVRMGLGMSLRNRRIWRLARAGDINNNPTTIEQRASTFAAGAGASGHTSLVVTRDEDGLGHWALMPDTKRVDTAALNLSHAGAGRPEPQEEPPDP